MNPNSLLDLAFDSPAANSISLPPVEYLPALEEQKELRRLLAEQQVIFYFNLFLCYFCLILIISIGTTRTSSFTRSTTTTTSSTNTTNSNPTTLFIKSAT